MIAIPNAEIPDDAVNVELAFRDEDGHIVWHLFDLPLIDIVTCGECKYYNDDICDHPRCEVGDTLGTEPTDYCSYGERRTNE